MNDTSQTNGKVYIVGAGPGADDLITLRGLQALRLADVVLYDALISTKLLDESSPIAERIFVGKRCGRHSMKQEEISRLMVEKARQGRTVVRLKGGDPVIYGRAGEEALACVQAGVDFEIIPGVSSASGAACYAGIPLTHRGISSSLAFVTAHASRCSESPELGWKAVATCVDTLVIFMGGSFLKEIADALMDAGLPATRPVAVISQATCVDQKTVLGALNNIAAEATKAQLKTPLIIVVGEVTRLSEQLNWFERLKPAPVETVCAS